MEVADRRVEFGDHQPGFCGPGLFFGFLQILVKRRVDRFLPVAG